MAGRFARRRAVVTGGASGIGAVIAARLASEGASVALWDRDVGALSRSPSAHREAVDVTDEAAVARATSATEAALGGIDILVASAGITGPNGPVWEYPVAAWRQVMAVNADGVFLTNRAVVPVMLKGGWGRIVNIASINGQKGQFGQTNYSAAKAGVIGFSKALALESARKGITVNAVAPGYTATEMLAGMDAKVLQGIIAQIPVGRLAQPDEIAHAVAFLVHEQSGFITGATLSINGGQYLV